MSGFNRSEILKEMHEWLSSDRNRSFQRDKRIVAIEEILARDVVTDQEKAFIASHLGLLSNWYLTLGTVGVADHEPQGWPKLVHGMWIEYYHVRLLVEQWDRDPRKNKPPRLEILRPSLCLAMAMAFDKKDIVTWLGNRLAGSKDDGAFGTWGECRLPRFMASLYRWYSDSGGDEIGQAEVGESSPYARVFGVWDSEEDLAPAMGDICNFHVQQSQDKGDVVIGEFSRYPFNIIPFEIFAIDTLRRRRGLGMPVVDHPLMAEPFNHVPIGVHDPDDPLLEKIGRLIG